jgi:hypothetical protein
VFLTFTSLNLVLLWQLFYLFCSSIVINTVIVTAEPLSRIESGKFGALKSDSTHHFFRNACTKSGSLRFSQFSGCWLILSVCMLMSFDFPCVGLFGVRWFCYCPYSMWIWGRCGGDRMVVGFTATSAISAYHKWCCEFKSRSGWDVKQYVIKFVSDLGQAPLFFKSWMGNNKVW